MTWMPTLWLRKAEAVLDKEGRDGANGMDWDATEQEKSAEPATPDLQAPYPHVTAPSVSTTLTFTVTIPQRWQQSPTGGFLLSPVVTGEPPRCVPPARPACLGYCCVALVAGTPMCAESL